MHIIGGLYKQRKLHVPKGDKTRPTGGRLREAVFNICQTYIEGSTFLDLFAGSGAMGLEALSRGASQAVFVDSSKEAIRCLEHNVKALEVQKQSEIIYGNVFQIIHLLDGQKRRFDLIFADPPYNTLIDSITYSEMVIQLIDQSSLLNEGGYLFVEEAASAAPKIVPKTLQLIKSRKCGDTVLLQFGTN